MPINAPIRPQKGAKIPDNWFADLYDYILSLEVRGDLNTTTARRDRSGTVVKANFPELGGDSSRPYSYVAKITADNEDGTYDADEQISTAAVFGADANDGVEFGNATNDIGYLYELNELVGVPVGTFVVVHRVADASGDPIWYFDSGWGVGTIFPVDLTQTGGVAGDATTQCTFTYTVKSISAKTLLTVSTPIWNRTQYGKMVAATSGTAYVNSSGTVILYQTDEVPAVTVCS